MASLADHLHNKEETDEARPHRAGPQARSVSLLADDKLLLDNGNPLADTQWLAPTSGTVYGVALNHRSLLEQLEADFQQPPYQKAPATPVLFIKPRNTHTGTAAPSRCQPRPARCLPVVRWVW
jgi:5-oxopent-3-ene-1,2,5-tricarboxylate decarboxylase/2-hydroxyhepta-2,4-diene-1,7-dioate isomerase